VVCSCNLQEKQSLFAALQRVLWLIVLARDRFAAASPPTCILSCSQHCCKQPILSEGVMPCVSASLTMVRFRLMVGLEGEGTICFLHQALLAEHMNARLASYIAICLHKSLSTLSLACGSCDSHPELVQMSGLGFLLGSAEAIQDCLFVTDAWNR